MSVSEDTLLRLFLEAVYADEQHRTLAGIRVVRKICKEEGKREAEREMRARGIAA